HFQATCGHFSAQQVIAHFPATFRYQGLTSLLDAPSLAVCVIFNRSIQPSSSQFELRLSWPSLQPTLSNDESPAHLRHSPRNRLTLRCGLPPSRILMTRGIWRDIGS